MSDTSNNNPSDDGERVWPSGPHQPGQPQPGQPQPAQPPAAPAQPVPPQPSQPSPPPGFQAPQPPPQAPPQQPAYPQHPQPQQPQPYPQAPQQPVAPGWSNQPPPGPAPQAPAGWQPGHQPQGWQGQPTAPPAYGSYAPAPPPKKKTGLWIALGLLGLLLFGVIGLAGLLLLGDDDGDTETAGRNDRTDDPVTTEPGTGNTTETNSTSPEGTVPTPGTGVDQTIPDDEPIMREPTMSLELDDAIVDIEEYFAEVYPQLYGEPWVPVAEVFALSDLDGPTLDCGIAVPVERNAFYCSLGDFIAYDDVSLFPFLEERFGDLAPAMALAHEWAHAVQGRQGLLRTVDTVFTELQADCLAGAWSGRLLSGEGNMVGVSQADVDLAIGGWVFLGDRIGIPIDDPGAHGTGFDRVGAFGDGVTNGAQACVDYVSGGVTPVDIGVDDEFFQTQGNLDFETALDTLEVSLDQYWDGVAADLGVAEPDPTVLGAVSSSPGCTIEAGFGAAACDDQGLVVYRDNWVNVHNDIGDFATALVIAEAYAEVVSDDLGFEPTEARLECLAGSWAGSDSIQLSAGDLDEAILTFIGLGASERSVFDSVSSFQRGYFAGFEGCI